MIVLICGLPGVGKTTIGSDLAPLLDAVILSTDKIRKEMVHKPTYSAQERRLIYDVMLLLAKYLHQVGENCILDATFNTEKSRKAVIERLNLFTREIYVVECICPEDIVISRLNVRKSDYSDADLSIYRKMKEFYEPVRGEHILVDTSVLSSKEYATEISYIILSKDKNNRKGSESKIL